MKRCCFFVGPLLALSLLMITGGCSTGQWDKVVRYYPGMQKGHVVSSRVEAGWHFVAVKDHDSGLRAIRGTEYIAGDGERLGLFVNEDGMLIATCVVGEVFVGPIPTEAKYVAWVRREHPHLPPVRDPEPARISLMTFNPFSLLGEAIYDALLNHDDDRKKWRDDGRGSRYGVNPSTLGRKRIRD